MAISLAVSFHGGRGKQSINNLQLFPGNKALLADKHVELNELRGFTLGPPGDAGLYVTVANEEVSQILRFDAPSRAGGQYTNGRIFASSHMHHPFAARFGPDGNLYVSNQDESTDGQIKITVYDPFGKHIRDFAGGFKRLRAIMWAGNTLYAADKKGGKHGNGAIIPYDRDGKAGPLIEVSAPVHLDYDGSRFLYIGSEDKNAVYLFDTQSKTGSTEVVKLLKSTKHALIEGTAGLALSRERDGKATLFVAGRKSLTIISYALDLTKNPPEASKGKVLLHDLTDEPEFLAVIGDA